MKYQCRVCKFVFDEEKEGVKWHELHDDWRCPHCRATKCSCIPLRAHLGSDTAGTRFPAAGRNVAKTTARKTSLRG
ncbi:MAG: rubredoxin [Opitutales bacterium]|nr:rubredoxin [Opitutales bacterium]